ncbi:MAG: DUF1871 domain-containing protein [Ruminococcus flavefaciens]|nr:DUF1871 domain-containing protein [Ruminococcus flavefaciens]
MKLIRLLILEDEFENSISGKKVQGITIIINDWDPVGFFPMAPKDEYMNEITKIYEYICINPNSSIHALAEAINKIFCEAFGTDVYCDDIESCMLIAEKILGNAD